MAAVWGGASPSYTYYFTPPVKTPSSTSRSSSAIRGSCADPSPPGLTCGDAKPSVIQHVPGTTNHAKNMGLVVQLRKFLDAQDVHIVLELAGVTVSMFNDVLKPELDKINTARFAYFAEKQILTIMFPSDVHEAAIGVLGEMFMENMAAVRKLVRNNHSELSSRFILGYNQNTFYKGSKDEFLADITIKLDVEALFHIEVAFSQASSLLLAKVSRILEASSVWGVLVVKIKEKSAWGNPDGNPGGYEMDYAAWSASASQAHAFDGITVDGKPWLHEIECSVALFPSDWDTGSDIPQFHDIAVQGNINLAILDAELSQTWSNVIRDVLIRLNNEDAMPRVPRLVLRWEEVRSRIAAALRTKGYHRYVKWHRGHANLALEASRPASPARDHRPRKKAKTS